VKIGIQFFVTGYTIDPASIARAVEDAGFDSFWVPDHAILPVKTTTPYSMTGGTVPPVYGQMADPFVSLAFIGAATTTLKLATGVCIVPERHPLILAKAVSTLDNFSGGRVIFGIGNGWMREEIELFGTSFDTRGRSSVEAVEAMKALWRDGSAAYEGEYVKFPEVICDPRPVQQPHPPVVLGGPATAFTYKRVARMGDGWFAIGLSPEEVGVARAAITAECRLLGRDPDEVEISVGVWDAAPQTQEAYEAAGADRLVVELYNHTGEVLPMEQWWSAFTATMVSGPPTPAETMRALESMRRIACLH
jgi:probable F420-dependent oxidoreductase